MKLLLITTSYPDGDEGAAAAGSFVVDFAHALAAEGVMVTVVAPGLQAGLVRGKVEVRRFAVPRLPLSLLKPWHPGHWPAIVKTLRQGQQAVNQACMDHSFDHILALWALPSGEWARRAGKKFSIPYSTWALGSDIWTLGKVPIIRRVLRNVLRKATMRFADGFQLASDVVSIADMSCEFMASTRRLPEVPSSLYKQAPPFRLAFLGRWHPNKGVDLLLQALKQLGEDDWSKISEVRLFGGGPLEDMVRTSVQELQQRGRPLLLGGYLDRQAATALLAWTDYLVIPSRIESIPVIFSDAMQIGCPVISTPVGDLGRLIEKYQCGIATNNASVEAIVTGIRRALDTSPAAFNEGVRYASADFDIVSNARMFIRAVNSLR